MSASTRLTAVQTAINDILTKGQSISDDGSTYTRANLKDLMEYEKQLETQVARESTTTVHRTVVEY